MGASGDVVLQMEAHHRNLQEQRHENGGLQREFNVHGEGSFEFRFLERVERETDLQAREQFWIEKMGTLNLCAAGSRARSARRSPTSLDRSRKKRLDKEIVREWAVVELTKEWRTRGEWPPTFYTTSAREELHDRWKRWKKELAARCEEIAARHFDEDVVV